MVLVPSYTLKEISRDLRRLQKAGRTWEKIGLVLFNRDGSYAAKVLKGAIIPSDGALNFYRTWKAHDRGKREEASPELCEAVWDYLQHCGRGRKYARTSREMGDYFLVHPRKIRRAAAILRDEGFLVGSCGDGYYEIVEPGEKQETIRKLWAHEKGTRKARLNVARSPLVDWRTNAVMVAEGVSQFQLPT